MSPQAIAPAGEPLSGRQRRHLRGLAHALKPVVHVGEAGITPAVVQALEAALGDHELVKVRLHQPDDKKSAARDLAERSHAHLCGVVGHTVVLYRRRDEDPRVEVPGLVSP
jgi:RNA-binding protein